MSLREGDAKERETPEILGSGTLWFWGAQAFLDKNACRWPPQALTPLMMCWGGILTTTRRVASSLGPQVLMPSMGDRSAGSKTTYGFRGTHRLSRLPAIALPQSSGSFTGRSRSPTLSSDKGLCVSWHLPTQGKMPPEHVESATVGGARPSSPRTDSSPKGTCVCETRAEGVGEGQAQ